MTVHQSVLELIGRTPVVRAQRMDTGLCELFLKLESTNPGGSIKDRIGLSMVEGAEKRAIPGWAWPWSRSRRATG
jgi:cystathionine beta-synthase